MPVENALLEELCGRTLERTDFAGLGRRDEGKVRDSYIGEKRRTIITLAHEPAAAAKGGAK